MSRILLTPTLSHPGLLLALRQKYFPNQEFERCSVYRGKRGLIAPQETDEGGAWVLYRAQKDESSTTLKELNVSDIASVAKSIFVDHDPSY